MSSVAASSPNDPIAGSNVTAIDSRSASPSVELTGPSLGHEVAAQFLFALEAGDHEGALALYTDASSWEDRAFCVEFVAESDLDVAHLDAWHAAAPDQPLPLLVRGALHVVRGDERAALPDLRDASHGDDDNPIPWSFLLRCIGAQKATTTDLEALLAEMLERHALYDGHVWYVRGLAKNGSLDELVAFARIVNKILPAGSAVRAVVAVAVIESLISAAPDDHLGYLSERGLITELLSAAGQSVFHPNFSNAGRIPSIKATNAFIVALSMVGHEDLALMLTSRLEGAVTAWPLSYLGHPTEAAWATLNTRLSERSLDAAITHDRAGQKAS